ncbi:hypothetical protein BDV35DRAFT_199226 [Aspergillus flavus]|uniref:Uncharacterized protein n=1 Tax=Aspergillus flavus TaxID=5059 RepID=A0A5N6H283_ASPFL|nr:hypothetical protein BDV35DRAFT_199226 [Aspergillus flavus]
MLETIDKEIKDIHIFLIFLSFLFSDNIYIGRHLQISSQVTDIQPPHSSSTNITIMTLKCHGQRIFIGADRNSLHIC